MPKQLAETQAKLENVERQLETAKAEIAKPFVQEEELAQKLEAFKMQSDGAGRAGMEKAKGKEETL